MDQKWEEKLNAGRMAIKARAKQARALLECAQSVSSLLDVTFADREGHPSMLKSYRKSQLRDPGSPYWQAICAGYAQAVWNGHGLVHTDVG